MVVARSNSQGIFVFKITMEKKCTKCGEVKSLDEFYNHKEKNMVKLLTVKVVVKVIIKTIEIVWQNTIKVML